VNSATESTPHWRTGLFLPAVVAFAAFTVLCGLGAWQLERKAWKESLIEALDVRLNANPVALLPAAQWSRFTAAADEFRRVTFGATIEPSGEALVYAAGSAFHPDISGPGYWVFARARLAGGEVVVINRGFIQEGQQQIAHDAPPGRVELTGALRWPEERGSFAPKDDPAKNLWFVRDHIGMARAKQWGDVAPFYVELETPTGPSGVPRAGRLQVSLRNDHLQYALTWFGLAVCLMFVFGFWVRSRARGASAG
jgi:surfeit locus 1 family protein